LIQPFGYILAFLRAIIVIGAMLLWLFYYIITKPIFGDNPKRAFALRKNWLKYVGLPVLNIQVSHEGKPQSGSALYVCNHRSFSDPLVLCNYLDAYVIAKAEVANYPVINWGAKLTGVLYVKRNNKDSRNAVREMMVDTIKNGYNVLVYPEGTIGLSHQTLPFKVGSFLEATRNNITVVPVAMEYKYDSDLWRYENFFVQFATQFSKWKSEVKLKFGPPMTDTDGEELKDRVVAWVNDQLEDMQKNWSEINFIDDAKTFS